MNYWPTILDALEAGLAGDSEKCKASTQMLLENLQENGDQRIASNVLHILSRHPRHEGQALYPIVSQEKHQ